MKVLFLDVDGVLNSLNSGGMYALKRLCLKRLENIVKDTGCKIVLSSTWRKDEYALKRLKRVLKYRGLEIYGTTPIHEKGFRGEEINWWLRNQDGDIGIDYAIVDDNSDFYENQLPHFFQTDPQYGLTDVIAYRIAYHLGIKDSNGTST